ncbi:MAG TPA: hypothetical protein VHA34_03085, partial [Actinomycetes bacterium]|nr:hypothetical protein [Actinomycetes bacterium]
MRWNADDQEVGDRVSLYRFSTPPRPSSRYRDDDHYGVLRLTLSPTSWSSAFHRTDGQVVDRATA